MTLPECGTIRFGALTSFTMGLVSLTAMPIETIGGRQALMSYLWEELPCFAVVVSICNADVRR
jgi:hypothetical protein